MTIAEKYKQALSKYLPASTEEVIFDWIRHYKVDLTITRPRMTKLGDYRPPFRGKPHRISINNNLNPYAFLITMVHEFAHLTTWEKYKNKINPHGKEWKAEFNLLMQGFLNESVLPEDVLRSVTAYIQNPSASSCVDKGLQKVLRKYDNDPYMHLEELPPNTLFYTRNGKLFQKGNKLRKRYMCHEVNSKRKYLVHQLAEVIPARAEG